MSRSAPIALTHSCGGGAMLRENSEPGGDLMERLLIYSIGFCSFPIAAIGYLMIEQYVLAFLHRSPEESRLND
jgi:hypothetical protein